MAGHSKWSKVKHSKGPFGVGRGAASGKLVKEITVAARFGDGGDGSVYLRLVVEGAFRLPSPSAQHAARTVNKHIVKSVGIHSSEPTIDRLAA